MPKYQAVNNVFVNDEVHPAGTIFDNLPADKADPLIERGSLKEYEEPKIDQETGEPIVEKDEAPARKGEVIETVTVDDNEYKKLYDGIGYFYTLNGAEEISEEAFVNAKQAVARQEIETQREENVEPTTVHEGDANASDPLSTTDQDGPQSHDDQSTTATVPPTPEQQASSETTSPNLHLG